ncbi:MAG: hypothetical protein LQ347_005781 [Umbilicaria vellea]|nr:MAG: hypothetical protein LQ347_005781 [Umbilicaria vellea]
MHHNANAVPIPGDVSAAFRTLADAFERMRQDGGGDSGLLDSLVESLMADAEMPPREVKGVPDSFLDDRMDLMKKKEPPPAKEEEEDEDWDDMYA